MSNDEQAETEAPKKLPLDFSPKTYSPLPRAPIQSS